MEVAELKTELVSLNASNRRQILAFLVALEREADFSYRQKLAEKIDDRNPDHWIRGEDLEAKLGLNQAI